MSLSQQELLDSPSFDVAVNKSQLVFPHPGKANFQVDAGVGVFKQGTQDNDTSAIEFVHETDLVPGEVFSTGDMLSSIVNKGQVPMIVRRIPEYSIPVNG